MSLTDDIKDVISRIKLKLNAEHKFMEAKLKDGTIVQYEGELNVGTKLNVIDAGGTIEAAQDATHELEDGTLVTTEGGFVTDIKVPEPVVEVEIEASKPVKMEDVEAAIATALANVNKAEVAALKTEMAAQSALIKDMFAVIEKLAEDPSAPADKPSKTSFSKQIQNEKASVVERMQAAAQKFAERNK
jgi:preprotein translocase subunit YajC